MRALQGMASACKAADVADGGAGTQAARRQLPSLFEQLRQAFQRRASLRMPYGDAVAAVLAMHLADEGMSHEEAGVHLELLARAAPDWLQLQGAGKQRAAVIGRMCTGVRQRLEDVAHGYAHV
jgi:DNA replication factor Cdt1 C-terminal domain